MSADNWGDCPKCKVLVAEKNEAEIESVNKLYGTVSVEDFKYRLGRAGAHEYERGTLREDYEMGVTSHGLFYISYRGYCAECGFEHEFEHGEDVEL